MGSAVLTNSVAVHVGQSSPTTNYNSSPGLYLRTSSGADQLGYLYFPRPFPLGATIITAKVKFYNAYEMSSATHTLTFQRLNQSFSASKVTYNTRPTSLIAGTKAVTKTGVVAVNTEWEIDVTDWLQSIANGGVNYGMRVISNEAVIRTLYSDIHPSAQYRPRLEVTWSDAPSTPSGLAPSGGRAVGLAKPVVRAAYVDVSGATALQAIQVQINATDVWTTPAFDSGIVLTSVPELDLAGFSPRAATISTTNASTTITAATATFDAADIGGSIVGAGIPAGATITAVASGTSATISAAATATGTPSVTITRAYAGVADGATVFWRVRMQDAAGLWSGWSAAATFRRDDKGTLAVSNPPSGTPKVEDTTPPIIWTFTGETQAAYQVQISHDENGTRVLDWDSGKTTSTVSTVTVPVGRITEVGKTFRVTVRVWDSKQREATPGDPAYVEVVRDFTFTPGVTTGTTGLTAVAGDPRPKTTLTWQRTSAPDTFNVTRNGKVLPAGSGLLPGEVFVSGTTYSWVDNSPSPGRPLTYAVQAVVNGIASATNATAVVTVKSVGVWLREPVTGLELCVLGDVERSFILGRTQATLQPIAPNANEVVINQSLGGLKGRIEGELHSYAGLTAQQWRDQYLQLRALRVKRLWLTVGDYTFQAVCDFDNYGHRGPPGTRFKVGFDFTQQDAIASALLGS